MRRFIYLDTDTLNSYLAQIFDGLIQSQEMEKSAGKKKEKQNHFGSNLGSQIAFKLFGKGIDANAQATYEHLKTVANDEMVRDVQTKIMHDNAFDEFASYLSENGLLGGANIGNFISVEDEFYIFDIAFFQIINSIFSFRGVRGCSGLYRCEKTQQIQGFSICWAVNRLLWLAVPARSGVNGFILGRVDFLLIFPPHQHQPGTAHTSGNRYPPGGGYIPRLKCRGSSPNTLKQ